MSENRYDYWFPLATLGFCSLLASMGSVPTRSDFGWYGYVGFPAEAGSVDAPSAPVTAVVAETPATSASEEPGVLELAFDEDLAALPLIAFVASLVFLAVTLRSRGRPVARGRFAVIAVLGAVEIVAAASVLERARALFHDGGFASALALPLVVLGLFCGMLAVFLRGGWRRVAACVGGATAVLVGYAVTVPVVAESTRLLLVTVGLSVLVWWYRSVLLAVVTAAFLLSALHSAGGPLPLLLPATVLLAGAVAALVLRQRLFDRTWTMNR